MNRIKFKRNVILIFSLCFFDCHDHSLNHDNYSHLRRDTKMATEDLRNNIMNDCIVINKDKIVYDTKDKKIKLDELFDSKSKLFVKYSELACSSCIEEELALIGKYDSIIGRDNIVILTSYNNSRKLKVFKKAHNINYTALYGDNLDLPFERTNEVFIFVCDTALLVRHFFVPDVSRPALSKEYYSAICERYFKD